MTYMTFIFQLDCIVIDVSGSMRARSHVDPLKTREDVSKVLFHTMVDKLVCLELRYVCVYACMLVCA